MALGRQESKKQEAKVPKYKIQINKQAGDKKLARKRQRGEAKETREQYEEQRTNHEAAGNKSGKQGTNKDTGS